jgi:hypothetical protein
LVPSLSFFTFFFDCSEGDGLISEASLLTPPPPPPLVAEMVLLLPCKSLVDVGAALVVGATPLASLEFEEDRVTLLAVLLLSLLDSLSFFPIVGSSSADYGEGGRE